MAALCDVYVNDAFGTAHRAEATTHGIAKFAKVACAGPLLAAELEALGRALANPKRPLVAIVAGSKVSTKLTILKSLASQRGPAHRGRRHRQHVPRRGRPADRQIARRAGPGGGSARDHGDHEGARRRGADPRPTWCAPRPSPRIPRPSRARRGDVEPDDLILDIGPQTARAYAEVLKGAGTIVWNGPVGVFEFEAFGAGTRAVAEAIASSKAFSLAGGGDTLAAIAKYGVGDRIGYISTGGGAFLEFLEGKRLPAVAALEERATHPEPAA